MENIAKAIVKNKIHKIKNINSIIQTLNDDDILRLIYLIINLIVNLIINDDYSFTCLKLILFNSQISLYGIHNSHNIINSDHYINYEITYELLMCKYNTDLNYSKVEEYIKILNSIDGVMIDKIKLYDFDDIQSLKQFLLSEFTQTVMSFNDKKYIELIKQPPKTLVTTSESQKIWIDVNSHELCERLVFMVKMFGTNYLYSFCNITKITINDFNKLNYYQKVKYYIKCAQKL